MLWLTARSLSLSLLPFAVARSAITLLLLFALAATVTADEFLRPPNTDTVTNLNVPDLTDIFTTGEQVLVQWNTEVTRIRLELWHFNVSIDEPVATLIEDQQNRGIYVWTVGELDNVNNDEIDISEYFAFRLFDLTGDTKTRVINGFEGDVLKSRGFTIKSNIPRPSSTSASSSSTSSSSPSASSESSSPAGSTVTVTAEVTPEASSPATTILSPSPYVSSSASTDDGGLSSQTKLAIGLGVGLGISALLALLVLLLLFRRRRSRAAAAQLQDPFSDGAAAAPPETSTISRRPPPATPPRNSVIPAAFATGRLSDTTADEKSPSSLQQSRSHPAMASEAEDLDAPLAPPPPILRKLDGDVLPATGPPSPGSTPTAPRSPALAALRNSEDPQKRRSSRFTELDTGLSTEEVDAVQAQHNRQRGR